MRTSNQAFVLLFANYDYMFDNYNFYLQDDIKFVFLLMPGQTCESDQQLTLYNH